MQHPIELHHLKTKSDQTCFVLKSIFSEQECDSLLNFHNPSFISANTHYPPSYRNNDRYVLDSVSLASKIFQKINNYIPALIKTRNGSILEEWGLIKINSRLRFCRYQEGQYFHRHLDGVFHESEIMKSKLTFMLYLNGSQSFEGGRTLFYDSMNSKEILSEYTPCKGDVIIFDHNIWHEGEKVLSGVKYILRSDILYENLTISEISSQEHKGYIWSLLKLSDDLIISAGRDRTIKIWEAGTCIQNLQGHDNSVLSLSKLNKDSFISGSRDASVKIWKRNTDNFFSLTKSIQTSFPILKVCNWKKDSFLAGNSNGEIIIFEKEEILKTLPTHSNWVWDISILSEEFIVTCSEDGFIKVWDSQFKSVCSFYCEIPVHSLEWLSEENILLAGDFLGKIHSFHFKTNTKELILKNSFQIHSGIVRTILDLQNGLIASGSEDCRVCIFEKNTGIIKNEFLHSNFVQSLVLNKGKILSSSYDGKILECTI